MEASKERGKYVIHWKLTLLTVAGFLAFLLINFALNGLVPEFLRLTLGLWGMFLFLYFNRSRFSLGTFFEHALTMLVACLIGGLALVLFRLI